jgi:tartrate dehydrogenase/decarboxylase/D-malate dehydrogenase
VTTTPSSPEAATPTSLRIAVIPGDGIGREVMPVGLDVLDAVARRFDLDVRTQHFDWSCERYRDTGQMMPPDGLDQLRDFDAILLGAVGYPGVPDHLSLWGLLLPIRRGFDQYVNLRPVRCFAGVPSPLRPEQVDGTNFWVVRENSEGEYSQIGGRFTRPDDDEVHQTSVFTRAGTERIMRFAFELAGREGLDLVTSATKSNGLYHSMPFWDERFAAVAAQYPQIATESAHIDILAARFVSQPAHFRVVVASNLFGDILSDLGPAVTGTFTITPSANLNPDRRFPSMFEPVHGSAPDIAGTGVANPIAQVLSAAMMLEHLGHRSAAQAIETAVEALLRSTDGPRTPDLGGTAGTADVGAALVGHLSAAG